MIEAESQYASWDRLALLGAIMTLFATSLGLFWLAILPLNLAFSWIFLLIPSIFLGFWGLLQYFYAKDKMTEVNKKIKIFLQGELILSKPNKVPINEEPINSP